MTKKRKIERERKKRHAYLLHYCPLQTILDGKGHDIIQYNMDIGEVTKNTPLI